MSIQRYCFMLGSLSLVFLLLSGCKTAAQHSKRIPYPSRCQFTNMQWHGRELVLNTQGKQTRQQVIIFHNLSNRKIMINHNVAHPSASAGWSSDLSPDRWTAFAVNKNHFTISCYLPGSYQQVSCQQILQACRIAHPQFTTGSEGSYWITENRRRYPELLDQVRLRGISW